MVQRGGLSIIAETMEDNNAIEEGAFIPADHDYSGIMSKSMMDLVQKKGQNDRKGMYMYVKYMHNIFRKQFEIYNLHLAHDSTGKTQLQNPRTDEAAAEAESAEGDPPAGQVDP